MTNKEAYEILFNVNTNVETAKKYGKEKEWEYMLACETGRKALEKQIPLKPYGDYNPSECPVCGAVFSDAEEDFHWCPYCGQRLSWEPEND